MRQLNLTASRAEKVSKCSSSAEGEALLRGMGKESKPALRKHKNWVPLVTINNVNIRTHIISQ